MSKGTSWGHTLGSISMNDRRGTPLSCGHPRCTDKPVFAHTFFAYKNRMRTRYDRRRRFLCERHAQLCADKHGLEVPR